MERYQIDDTFVVNNILKSELSEIDNELTNDKKENIIDSYNINIKVNKLVNYIKQENCSSIAKIKIAEFLCNKLCDIYKLSIEKKDIIIEELYNCIYNDNNIPIAIRLYYLRFRNETIPYPVSCKLYQNGIKDRLETIPYFQILKYILKSYLVTEEIKISVLDEFENMFVDDNVSIFTKMEIADIYLLNRRLQRGNEMINIIRNFENNELEINNNENNFNRIITVYNDSQNVHSTDINNSILNACVRLIDIEQKTDFNYNEVLNSLLEISPDSKVSIETVLQRIEIDTSRFTVKDNSFNLYIVFSSLWNYIKKHPSFIELKKRMIEEIIAMTTYCTTGHLSRFINVIQGYTEDKDLQLRISDEEQIKSVVTHYLDTEFINAPDEVIDSMISNNQKLFYDYIILKMNIKIPNIIEVYGNIQEHIVTSIKRYSKWNYWELDNNNILKLINP